MSVVNQKEYLKKYLGIGKASDEKKKKKKKVKALSMGLKIVDDDIDLQLNEEIQEDLIADNEDAPQIVSVIDDRPPSLRIDEETHSKLWKPIGQNSDSQDINKSLKFGSFQLSGTLAKSKGLNTKIGIEHTFSKHNKNLLPSKKSKDLLKNKEVPLYLGVGDSGSVGQKMKEEKFSLESDNTPPRKRKYSDSDVSPLRKHKLNEDDTSPFKKHKVIKNEGDFFKKEGIEKRKYQDKDISPLRKSRTSPQSSPNRNTQQKNIGSFQQSAKRNVKEMNRTDSESDFSPPRKNKDSDGDISPLRKDKKIKYQDISPPRRTKHRNKDTDEDISPPRKKNPVSSDDKSSPRCKGQDNSSHSSRKKSSEGDFSPPRKQHHKKSASSNYSPPRKHKTDASKCRSPHRRKRSNSPHQRRSRWGDWEEPSDKLNKTLDGKKAGLQNANDLVGEMQELKKREDELFKNMSTELSGIHAKTVVRSKKKEQVDLEQEELKRKREQETKKQYDQWGKGLKQVEDINTKIQNDLYEMNKPLARYADDEDLEKYLKEQEREGDPMLAYLRQKKKKTSHNEGIPLKPQYQGDAPPNRFGIRPGYRWDGVDRSNGYEKKFFEVQNSRKANIEESYKWSTEDM